MVVALFSCPTSSAGAIFTDLLYTLQRKRMLIGWTLHWGPFPIRWSYRACGHMPFVSRDSFGRCALLGISMIIYKEREELGFKRTHSTEYIQHSINSTRLWNSFYQQDLSVQHPGGRLRSSTHLVGVLELMWEAPALPMMKRYENTKRFRQLLWSQFCSISTFKFILVLPCSMIPCISSSWRYDAWISICVCVSCHDSCRTWCHLVGWHICPCVTKVSLWGSSLTFF